MSDTVLILRTCDSDLRSWGGFQWPEHGYIEAPDWDPEPCCGKGLHGLLWGEGFGLLDWSGDAKWLVVAVRVDDVVSLGSKVKFRAGEVICAGSREDALAVLDSRPEARKAAVVGACRTAGDFCTAAAGYRGTAIAGTYGTAIAGDYGIATAGVGGTAIAGYDGTATVGYDGTATAGCGGTATAGDCGTATVGYGGIAIAGDDGIATAGVGGTAIAGYDGTLVISYWTDRRRTVVGHVVEDGIFPGVAYKLDSGGCFIPA